MAKYPPFGLEIGQYLAHNPPAYAEIQSERAFGRQTSTRRPASAFEAVEQMRAQAFRMLLRRKSVHPASPVRSRTVALYQGPIGLQMA